MTKTVRAEAETGTGTPEPRIRARNEDKILRAAVDLFAARGSHGTHVREIALASGLPRPSR